MAWLPYLAIIASLFLQGSESQTTPFPCPSKVQLGDNPDKAVTSQTNADHGKARTVVLFDPLYTVQCCGVVTSWEMEVYMGPDGCTTGCKMDFMVFDGVDLTVRKARLTGVNANYTIVHQVSGVHTTVAIPQNQQLPVKAGDVVGYNGVVNGIEYYDDDATQQTCLANGYMCNQNYMTTSAASQISGTVPGDTYTFQTVGAIDFPSVYRFYGFRAIVEKGAAPKFENLPASANVPYTAAIGTSVFKIFVSDLNSLDTLKIKLVRQCPIPDYFTLSSSSKNSTDVTVAKSLATEPYLTHTLTIEVTDGCQTTTQTLDIIVNGPVTTTTQTTIPNTGSTISSVSTASTPKSSTSGSSNEGLLSTTDGKVLVGLLAAALAVAIATAVGICCLCYQLRSVMGSGKAAQPQGDPYYNYDSQYQNNQYQRPRPSRYPPAKPNNLSADYPNEPRPASFRPDYSSNKVGPQDAAPNGHPTPRDIHLRATTPNRFYKDQLFW